MWLRVSSIVGLAACASGPAYRLSVRDSYGLGGDRPVGVSVKATSDGDAVLVITRRGGSTVRQRVPLRVDQTNVRFGNPGEPAGDPTFNELGDYRVELRINEAMLARQEVRI